MSDTTPTREPTVMEGPFGFGMFEPRPAKCIPSVSHVTYDGEEFVLLALATPAGINYGFLNAELAVNLARGLIEMAEQAIAAAPPKLEVVSDLSTIRAAQGGVQP